jgi:hypothetical protein
MTRKGYKPPKKRFRVDIEFDSRTVYITARTKSEACRLAREKVRDGRIKPRICPNKYSSQGGGVIAEPCWRSW